MKIPAAILALMSTGAVGCIAESGAVNPGYVQPDACTEDAADEETFAPDEDTATEPDPWPCYYCGMG